MALVSVFFASLLLALPGQTGGSSEPGEGDQPPDEKPTAAPTEAGRKAPGSTRLETAEPWLVGVLPSIVEPEVADDLEKSFRGEVEKGLTSTGHMVVARDRVEMVRYRFPLLESCRSGPCLAQVAKAMKADVMVRLRAKRTGKNYAFRLVTLDPKQRVSVEVKGRCDICTISEARGQVKSLAVTLGKKLMEKKKALPKPPSPLGGPCGKERKCMEGMVCVEGKCAWKRPPARPPRKKVTPRPRPRPRPRPTIVKKKRPPKPKRSHPWGQFAIVTGSVSVVTVIVGASLVAIDNEPSCDRPNPEVTCPGRYDTAAAGGVLLAAGIVAGAASALFGYMWWKDRETKKKKVDVSVAPLPGGGAAASATFRF